MPAQDVSGVHLWLVMIKAFQAVGAHSLRDLEGTGLGESDFRVLEILLHKGPQPVNALGPKVFLTPGSISTAVQRLHKKHLVSRTGSPTDRRIHLVDLTAQGRALIQRVFHAHEEHMERLAEVLSQTERVQLIEALKKWGKYAEGC